MDHFDMNQNVIEIMRDALKDAKEEFEKRLQEEARGMKAENKTVRQELKASLCKCKTSPPSAAPPV